MRTRTSRARVAALAAIASLSLAAAACGSDDNDAATTSPAATDAGTEATTPMATDAMGTEPMGTDAMGTEPMTSDGGDMMGATGPACGTLPTDGPGSLAGMAEDPAATAASNNPELSTLVAAVTAADLVDTLNGPGPFTIFAPVNSAFDKIPPADLDAVLADTDTLTSILTYHVIPEQLSSTELVDAGTLTTVNGADLEVTMDGDTLTINGGEANVVCADVPTANATVYLIDSVLMPPADGAMSSDTTAPAEGASMMEPSGPACASLPADGQGSLAGMADDPAATAASNNPELSTLVAAVQAAGLVDTLNGPGPFTIFAPVNSAFEKIPSADLDAVLADTDQLTSILTYHVIPEQLNSDELVAAGTLTTVNGADVTVAKDGDTIVINDGAAMVGCADIPTANATVYLIDSVLMPPA